MSIFRNFFSRGAKGATKVFDPENLEKSEEELIRESEQGNPVSAYRLALKYLDEDSSNDDIESAIKLLILSSSKGYPPSLRLLGNCFFYGKGVRPSRIIAGSLFGLARDSSSKKSALSQSPASHASISGHIYRKLNKSKNFTEDLARFSYEVGLYEQDQFVQKGKDPEHQLRRMLAFTTPQALEAIFDDD